MDRTTENRVQVEEEHIRQGLKFLTQKLRYRLEEKGKGTFSSRHEILGVLEEEMYELRRAVCGENNIRVADELLDVAVAAVYGYICVLNGYTEW
jgi:NTP pyrophosphatase (non-canonical NTP hydrolase)